MIVQQLRKLNTSSRTAVFASLVVIAALALHGWLIRPHLSYLQAVEQLTPVVDSMAQERQALREQLIGRRKLVDKLRAQVEQYKGLLCTPEQAFELESDIRLLAEQAGCRVTGIKAVKQTALAGSGKAGSSVLAIERREIAVNLLGAYDALIQWLDQVQTSFAGIEVRQLQISKETDASGALTCSLVLVFHVVTQTEALFDETQVH